MLNMNRANLFVFAVIAATVSASLETAPKVTLSHGGVLIGSYMLSSNNKKFSAFRGIRYGEPPVGSLRFKPPVPTQPWIGEKLADQNGPICVQQDPFLRIFTTFGEEDCLYLNVFSPKDRTTTKPLSVMFYIHGGGFTSGTRDYYHPRAILDHDIILVIPNYRLGALGFLTTGTEDCPGNNGLKDQALALKWVHDNIADFGGDPNDVTVFGHSAGGASVTYHMVSPLSKDLFHKAIIQAGTNFDPWAQLGDSSLILARTKKLSRLLSCPEENWQDLMACLNTKTADEIVSTAVKFYEFDTDPFLQFPPVLEPESEGAFLTKSNQNASSSNQIPIIIGVNTDEGVLKSGPILHLQNDEFRSRFEEALPVTLFYDNQPEEIRKNLTREIDQFYFDGKHDWTKKNHRNLTNLYSDRWFYFGMTEYLENRFKNQNGTGGKTYVYLFDHRGSTSISVNFSSGTDYYGVTHGDELPYLFPMSVFNSTSENDDKMKFALPCMWVNFARTGNPTPKGSELPTWKPSEKFPLEYAHIGSKNPMDWMLLRNRVGFQEDRMHFWKQMKVNFPSLL